MSLSLLPRASSSLLARSALPSLSLLARHAGAAQRRGVHFENSLYHNTPFSYENKKAFTAGYFGVMATLFSIPFVAVGYHLKKFNQGSVA